MIISFAKTTGALLSGQKTVTRRDWTDKHAAHFSAGMLVDAWNYSPRVVSRNPHKVATIRLTADPYQQNSAIIAIAPVSEWAAEGFDWMLANELAGEVKAIVDNWLAVQRPLWVVRFEVVEVLP